MEPNEVKINFVETDDRSEDEILAEIVENEIEVQDEGDNLEKVEE